MKHLESPPSVASLNVGTTLQIQSQALADQGGSYGQGIFLNYKMGVIKILYI